MVKPIDLYDIQPAGIIFGAILFFYIYYYVSHSGLLKRYISSNSTRNKSELNLFISKKVIGFIFLGIIPGILYYITVSTNFEKFGLEYYSFEANFITIATLTSIILFAVYANQKMNSQNSSLQLNYSDWNLSLFTINAVGWILYLISYEFLFRGILLFECYESFGFWPAIGINVAIYSAIHMVNGKQQALGALFFGAVACYFTLTRETIIIPIIMHVALSVGSDFFSIKLNANLNYLKQSTFKLPLK